MLNVALSKMWMSGMQLNKDNILSCLRRLRRGADTRFVDLGCDEGTWTKRCAFELGTLNVAGVDIVADRLVEAQAKGVRTYNCDIDSALPFDDNSVDVFHANQVIEHVKSVDNFASEIYRCLSIGGHAVISAENGSSWCNIAAAIFGWQMFSLTNLSVTKGGIGNPLAIHRGESVELGSWTHKTIFSYRGLTEFFAAHKFTIVSITGAGYFPLPAYLGRLDVRHSHFLTIVVKKQLGNQ